MEAGKAHNLASYGRRREGIPQEWNLETTQGFGEFYDYWAPRILRHALLRTNIKEDAEEITAKAFFKLLEYVRQGTRVRSASALLYRITNRLVIDCYRARSRSPVLLSAVIPDDDPPASSMEERVTQRYDLGLIKQALGKLRPSEASLVMMRFIDELSIEEIASATGKSRGAVSVALHRALHSLHGVIERDYGNLF